MWVWRSSLWNSQRGSTQWMMEEGSHLGPTQALDWCSFGILHHLRSCGGLCTHTHVTVGDQWHHCIFRPPICLSLELELTKPLGWWGGRMLQGSSHLWLSDTGYYRNLRQCQLFYVGSGVRSDTLWVARESLWTQPSPQHSLFFKHPWHTVRSSYDSEIMLFSPDLIALNCGWIY